MNKSFYSVKNWCKAGAIATALILTGCSEEESLNATLENNTESNLSSNSVELPIQSIDASTEQSANPATNAIDNSASSRWSGFGVGATLTLDLGSTNLVDYINIAFHKGDERTNSFLVQTSTNGSSFTQINSKNSSGNTESLETFDLSNSNARYVRLICNGNSDTDWNSILDIEIFGTPGDGDDGGTTTSNTRIPALIQAENYTAQSGTQTQSVTDDGDGDNVGWIDAGDSLSYAISVPSSGEYDIAFRVAAPSNNVRFNILQGSQVVGSINTSSTGGWQNWTTVSTTVDLNSGNQTITLDAVGGGWNINWMDFDEAEGDVGQPGGTGGLDPNRAPGQNFDLSMWNLGVPLNEGDGTSTDIRTTDLINGYTLTRNDSEANGKDYFYTANDGSMVFKNYIDGYKTSSGTSYTRTELREMIYGTIYDTRSGTSTKDIENNWVFSSSNSSTRNAAGGVDGELTATLKIDHVTTTGSTSSQIGRVIIGQIHASDDEPCRLYYRKLPGNSRGSIYFAHEPADGFGDEEWYEMIGSRSSSQSNPSDGIALGEVFSYSIKVEGNMLYVTIKRDGKPDVTEGVNMSGSGFTNDWMYFKAGVYSQNNSGDDDDYDQASFYALNVTHD